MAEMRIKEFRAWLVKRGSKLSAARTRANSVMRVETTLSDLGLPYKDLDEAWHDDQFEALRKRIKKVRQDYISSGSEDYLILMPGATKDPRNWLANWANWVRQYGEFLEEESQGSGSYADQIRKHVLTKYIDPARKRGDLQVEVRSRKVDNDLKKDEQWRNIWSALKGEIFSEMTGLPPPEIIGPPESSTTKFVFNLQQKGQYQKMRTTNLILYGPPGTGKTYQTAAEAVRLCGEDASKPRGELMETYKRLVAEKRIEFVTFHQSMSYEDFVEGKQPVTESNEDEDTTSVGFRLETVPGIFRNIAKRAETKGGRSFGGDAVRIEEQQVFKMALGRTNVEEDAHLFDEAINNGCILLGGSEKTDWSDGKYSNLSNILETRKSVSKNPDEVSPQQGQVKHVNIFRNSLKVGDIIVVSKGNRFFQAIGRVTGEYEYAENIETGYNHRRSVDWLWVEKEGAPARDIYRGDFIRQTIYQLSKDGINIAALERYMNSASSNTSGESEDYVLIIDEINRANISKVLGELITLLEPDKRLNKENEIKLRLPYSGDVFGVPANLHIIGTMNTADRSIALLDTALRRRFTFKEMMPDPSKLETKDGINLSNLLSNMNERIEYYLSREHQIGHGYFTECESRAEIDKAMRDKVIPLLAEYFFEDWEKIASVLWESGLGTGEWRGGFLKRRPLNSPPDANGDGSTRYRWEVRSEDEGFDYENLVAR